MNEKQRLDVIGRNVIPALDFAENKHGPLTTDHCRAFTILMEEVGEAAADILDIERQERMGEDAAAHEARTLAIAELSQVAAVAIRMISNLKEELT